MVPPLCWSGPMPSVPADRIVLIVSVASQDELKVCNTWSLCYNIVGGLAGWHAVPGPSLRLLDIVTAVRIRFRCTPAVLQTFTTAVCSIASAGLGRAAPVILG